MTIFQLKVAMATRELGSISNAAKQLEVSQPNASNSIKLLENEIGFEIFKRTRSGISLTEKGRTFLEHAERIIKEHESIMELHNYADIYRLRLGSVNYTPAVAPFLKLCEQHRDDRECDFKSFNVSIKEGVEELEKFNLDVVFALVLKSQIAGLVRICRETHLTMISVGELLASVSVRKGHPAALDGRCENLTFGSDALKEYPYLAYRRQADDFSATGFTDTDFVQSSYKIYVDGVDVRMRLLASTNAFSFGVFASKGLREKYGIASFPIPGVTLEACCLVRSGEEERKEISEYISLLREELEKNNSAV